MDKDCPIVKMAYDNFKNGSDTRDLSPMPFNDWFILWSESGKWEQKGTRKGEYCLGRIDKDKLFTKDNSKVMTNAENKKQANSKHATNITPRSESKLTKYYYKYKDGEFGSYEEIGNEHGLTYNQVHGLHRKREVTKWKRGKITRSYSCPEGVFKTMTELFRYLVRRGTPMSISGIRHRFVNGLNSYVITETKHPDIQVD